MKALCCECTKVVDAHYLVGPTSVELFRRCPDHGRTRSVVSSNPVLFAQALELAAKRTAGPRGLIIELLDGCNMTCPTCIAASSPELSALRRPDLIGRQLGRLQGSSRPIALLLSGGEPTIHPQFDQFVALVEKSSVSRRILITNGVRLATDPALADRLSSGTKPWEVFLQFDSLRPEVLGDMRGDQNLTAVRTAALEVLGEARIAATLVCVVKRGQNLDELESLIDFAISTPCVTGVQLQPIRNAGRLENYDAARHACDTSDVVEELLRMPLPPVMVPHPRSPLNVVVGYLDRRSRRWLADPVRDSDFFIDTTGPPTDRLRLSILEYSDSANWSSTKSACAPLNVLQRDGSVRAVDDHFVLESEGPAGLPQFDSLAS